jgi:hypothetical protein
MDGFIQFRNLQDLLLGSSSRLLVETAGYIAHGFLQETFLTDTRELPAQLGKKML